VPKVKTKDLMDAKAKLDSIRQAIISFKDSLTFEKAAEMNSDDKETKNNGGLMLNPKTGKSNFELQDMDKTIQDLVTKMKPGEISVPFLSINRAGKKEMQIIRLVKVIPMHKMNLKDDYQDIQNRALAEKKQKKINEWIQEKIKETYIHIDDSYKRCDFQYNWLKK
jgi:peptidyl-prolyl cis-trans isomerase SurA